MNRLLIFIFLATIFIQCAATREAPEFVGIEKLKITKFQGKTAELTGEAILYNPNKRGLTLKEVAIDVKSDDRLIGQINKSMNLKIPAESEFKVPLNATVNIGDIGVLNGILSMLGGKEIEINYSGDIKVSVYGVPRKLHIDHTEELQF
ncbi:MAG: LEA type 2 family protein [Bacteroidota bacterium]